MWQDVATCAHLSQTMAKCRGFVALLQTYRLSWPVWKPVTKTHPRPRLGDFPGWKKTKTNTRKQKTTWLQESIVDCVEQLEDNMWQQVALPHTTTLLSPPLSPSGSRWLNERSVIPTLFPHQLHVAICCHMLPAFSHESWLWGFVARLQTKCSSWPHLEASDLSYISERLLSRHSQVVVYEVVWQRLQNASFNIWLWELGETSGDMGADCMLACDKDIRTAHVSAQARYGAAQTRDAQSPY